jgi:putative membrane protein insertion efficiency factor
MTVHSQSGAYLLIRDALVRALSAPIVGYRRLISPLLPPACRFHPSCSAYALEALQTHGPAKGLLLAVRRLLRCHPFTFLGGGSGIDPVPPAHKKIGKH